FEYYEKYRDHWKGKSDREAEGKFLEEWEILYAGDGYSIAYDYIKFLNNNTNPDIMTRKQIKEEELKGRKEKMVITGIYYLLSIKFALSVDRMSGPLTLKTLKGRKAIDSATGRWYTTPGSEIQYICSNKQLSKYFKEFNPSKLTDATLKEFCISVLQTGATTGIGAMDSKTEREMEEIIKEYYEYVESDKELLLLHSATNYECAKIDIVRRMREYLKTCITNKTIILEYSLKEIKDLYIKLESLEKMLYNPPANYLRFDLFGFGVVILRKSDNIVISFKNSQEDRLIKLLKEGNYVSFMTYLDIIRKFSLIKILKPGDKISKLNITVTGYNVGGELANILSIMEVNYKSRPFFSNYLSSISDIVLFTVKDLGAYTNEQYRTEMKIIGDEIWSLLTGSLKVYGGAHFVGKSLNVSLSLFSKIKLGCSVATLPYLIASSAAFSIFNISLAAQKNKKTENLYLLLCYIGFFNCTQCEQNNCKYLKTTTNFNFPKLLSYSQIIENLSKTIKIKSENEKESIEMTGYAYLSVLFELFNETGNMPTDGSDTIGTYIKALGRTAAYFNPIISIVSLINQNTSEKEIININNQFKNSKTTTTEKIRKILKTEFISKIKMVKESEVNKYESVILDLSEDGDGKIEEIETNTTYEEIKYTNIVIEKKENNYVVKKYIWYKYRALYKMYSYNSPVTCYQVETKMKEGELSEAFDMFMWFVKLHIDLYDNYEKIKDNKKKYKMYDVKGSRWYSNVTCYANINNIAKIKLNSKNSGNLYTKLDSKSISEFAFFPYIDESTGDIQKRGADGKSIYIHISDDYVRSFLRSVIGNQVGIKDPKYYTKDEIEKIGGSKREDYLNIKNAYNFSSDISNLEATIIGLCRASEDSALLSFYSVDNVISKLEEQPSLIEACYIIEDKKGSGGIIKQLKLGIMTADGMPDESRIAYLYNDDNMKRGVIEIEVMITENSGVDIADADKKIVKSGAIIECDQCDVKSTFVAKFAKGVEMYNAEGEALYYDYDGNELDNTVGTTGDKRGGKNGNILPFKGACKKKIEKQLSEDEERLKITACDPETFINNWEDVSDIEIGDGYILTEDSWIRCKKGGIIRFSKDKGGNGTKTN
ncbi:hypothetical protein M2142_002309, partial [Fusobacterium sp. PH5-29]